MKKVYSIIVTLALLVFLQGCKRMELYELSTNVNLNLNLNLEINMELDMEVETELDQEFSAKVHGKMPEYIKVIFYDKDTQSQRASFVLPAEGGQVTVAPGDYHLLAYSLGTESTQIDGLGNLENAKAFTSDISQLMKSRFEAVVANARASENPDTSTVTRGYEDDPIVYEPDHLYVVNEGDIHVPSVTKQSENIVIHATASTILDVYSLEVLGVTGCENIEKVEAFITGQIKENYFGLETRGIDPATLYVTLKTDAANNRLYTIFGTFGKLPKANNKIYLDITVTDTSGGQYRYVYDVTDQFDDASNVNRKLVIRDEIDIPKGSAGGGGLAPSVGDWDNEEIDIPLS